MLSKKERDRRYEGIRAAMDREGLDTLLIASSSMRRGAIRYVSNHPIHFGETYCVFPRDGEPTLFTFSPLQTRKALDAGWLTDVRTSSDFVADLTSRLAEVTTDAGEWTVGLVGMDNFTVDVYEGVTGTSDGSFVRTDVVDRLRRTKSEEELELVRRSAEIADEAFYRVRDVLEPGVNEFDLYAELRDIYYRNRVAYSFDLVGSGRHPSAQSLPEDRTLEQDDVVNVELTPAYQGYYTQLAFQLPVGEVGSSLREKELARREAQETGLKMVRPGVRVDDIYREMRTVVERHGYDMPRRGGHCLGLEVNEQPVISPHSDMVLESNMVVTVHPMVVDDQERAFFADTYLVTDDGYERLNEVGPEQDVGIA